MALSPKSVLITGANRGIGLEFCKQFLKLTPTPKRIFAGCRNPDKAEDLNALAKANACIKVVKLDLLDQNSIEASKKVVESDLGGEGLNLLVNNAGRLIAQNITTTTKEEMMLSYETNVVGPMLVIQAYLPLLKKAASSQGNAPMSCNKAAIINLSTGVASITENSSGGMYPYRASKAGLNMVTSSLGLDLKGDGILCSAIHPGWVQTDMGGPRALVTSEESVCSMLKVIAKLQGDEGTGKFYHGIKGVTIPW